MSFKTESLASPMKIVGGVSTGLLVWDMLQGNAFTGTGKAIAWGVIAAAGFLAIRGLDQILFGKGAS